MLCSVRKARIHRVFTLSFALKTWKIWIKSIIYSNKIITLVVFRSTCPGNRFQEESDDGEITAQEDDSSDSSRPMMMEVEKKAG